MEFHTVAYKFREGESEIYYLRNFSGEECDLLQLCYRGRGSKKEKYH